MSADRPATAPAGGKDWAAAPKFISQGLWAMMQLGAVG